MKKISVFFGILLLTAGSVWSQSINIPLLPDDGTPLEKPRSLNQSLSASLCGESLYIDFSSATASQVVIMDENNHCQVVYSESFASSTQVIVDLEDEGIGEGHYLLWLFAFGEWWEGEFVLTDDENE